MAEATAEQRLGALLEEHYGLERAEAERAGATGYTHRLVVQATMPHRQPLTNEIARSNGDLTLSMMAPTSVGLPFGVAPRHILTWVTTEAVRTRSRRLVMGASYGAWLEALGVPHGGAQRAAYQRGAASLFGTSITCVQKSDVGSRLQAVTVADEAALWWDPKHPDQLGLWESTVDLSERFYASLVDRPVPVDLVALRRLGGSPLAIDLYVWTTYRMSYLRQPTTVPWAALHHQFGSEYGRLRDFRRKALVALGKVTTVYPEARVHDTPEGLRLAPSPAHVRKTLSPRA